jgi:hypothetical protein
MAQLKKKHSILRRAACILNGQWPRIDTLAVLWDLRCGLGIHKCFLAFYGQELLLNNNYTAYEHIFKICINCHICKPRMGNKLTLYSLLISHLSVFTVIQKYNQPPLQNNPVSLHETSPIFYQHSNSTIL